MPKPLTLLQRIQIAKERSVWSVRLAIEDWEQKWLVAQRENWGDVVEGACVYQLVKLIEPFAPRHLHDE